MIRQFKAIRGMVRWQLRANILPYLPPPFRGRIKEGVVIARAGEGSKKAIKGK